ncbi:MAG: RNA polymerase sigma factor [Solirubrobacterales bacterium]
MSYGRKSGSDLQRLADDGLIGEVQAARGAGDSEAARLALSVLLWRRYRDVVRRVQIKVPERDAEDVAMEALTSAIKSAFDGTSVGEFVNWLATITDRRIADYHRKRSDRPEVPLAHEHGDEEAVRGEEPSIENFSDDTDEQIDTREAVEQALSELGEVHRMVVEIYVFEDLSAKQTAQRVNMSENPKPDTPMTEANVHQIAKRFRQRLRRLLEDPSGPG